VIAQPCGSAASAEIQAWDKAPRAIGGYYGFFIVPWPGIHAVVRPCLMPAL
jgi:hypothetical protein